MRVNALGQPQPPISPTTQKPLFWAVPVFVFLVLIYWHLSESYPYFFLWDQDQILTLDTILINSGLLPDFIHHPAFGSYFFTTTTSRIASTFDILSAIDLKQLNLSLNPMLCLAQLVELLRRISPLILFGTVFLLWSALQSLLRPKFFWSLIALLVLGLEQGFLYHATMIRTELYSLFYWSGAMLSAVQAGHNQGKKQLAWMALCGLLSGLALLSKIQVSAYLIAVPVIFLLSLSLQSDAGEWILSTIPGRRQILVAKTSSLLALSIFLGLFIGGKITRVPANAAAFLNQMPLGYSPLLFAMFAVLLVTLLVIFSNKNSVTNRLLPFQYLAVPFSLLLLGLMLSFFCPFLLGLKISTASKYSLLLFKMIFLRRGGINFDPNTLIHQYEVLSFLWPVAIANLISVLLFAVYTIRRLDRGFPLTALLVFMLELLAYSQAFLLARPILRDFIWVELLLNINTLVCLLILSRNFSSKQSLGLILSLPAILILYGNIIGSLQMPARLNAIYNLYAWTPEAFAKGVYRPNQSRWTKLIKNHFKSASEAAWGPAGIQAAHAAEVCANINFVLPTITLDLRRVGVVAQGASISLNHNKLRLGSVPQDLYGDTLVDFTQSPINPSRQLRPEVVLANSESYDKFIPHGDSNLLSILPRPDLRVFLFVPSKNHEIPLYLKQKKLNNKPIYLLDVVDPDGESEKYNGYYIDHYCDIPRALLRHDAFIVIHPRLCLHGEKQSP